MDTESVSAIRCLCRSFFTVIFSHTIGVSICYVECFQSKDIRIGIVGEKQLELASHQKISHSHATSMPTSYMRILCLDAAIIIR